jgi:hypothetical protein
LPGGVVHIVWISAVMPDTGVSMQMAMGGEFPDYTPLQVPYHPHLFSQPSLNLQAFSMSQNKADFSPHTERRHTRNRGTRSLSLQRPRSHGNGPLVRASCALVCPRFRCRLQHRHSSLFGLPIHIHRMQPRPIDLRDRSVLHDHDGTKEGRDCG